MRPAPLRDHRELPVGTGELCATRLVGRRRGADELNGPRAKAAATLNREDNQRLCRVVSKFVPTPLLTLPLRRRPARLLRVRAMAQLGGLDGRRGEERNVDEHEEA